MPSKTNDSYSVRRLMRIMTIIVVYQFELLNERISSKKVFEEDTFNDIFDYNNLKTNYKDEIFKEQLQIISVIEKNYDKFKSLIIKYIDDSWSWNRIDPLVRSMLLCACVEVWKIDNIKIVANEYIEIAKDFIPNSETYKFINIMLENIEKEYNEFKKNRKDD